MLSNHKQDIQLKLLFSNKTEKKHHSIVKSIYFYYKNKKHQLMKKNYIDKRGQTCTSTL